MSLPTADTAPARRPALRIADLIVAEGPEGAERILVPGLTLSVAPGEIVALRADEAASTAALVDVLAGRRRAQYGVVATGTRGLSRRVAPLRASGVASSGRAGPGRTAPGPPRCWWSTRSLICDRRMPEPW